MEEEKVVDNTQAQSNSTLPTGLPINWGLITGPVQPVFSSPYLSTQLPLPQTSAAHTLQTKVKSLTQRRTRGRDREKERERLDTEDLVSSPERQISSEVLLRQRPRIKCQASPLALSWKSNAAKTLSSSDEEEELEVQVKLEIHSPPAEAKGEPVLQEGEGTEEERSARNVGKPVLLAGGNNLESLLSDNSSSNNDDTSCLHPLFVLSSSPATTTAFTTSSNSSSKSSTSTRHWAPPKGFWRVARPETLLLNGVGPNSISSTFSMKDYTQVEPLEGPQGKSKPAEIGSRSDVGRAVDDKDASSELKHSESMECYLDRCELKESQGKALCSSDSWECLSSQIGGLSIDEELKLKQRAYAKSKDRENTGSGWREHSGGESDGHEDVTNKLDCKVADAHGVLDSSNSAILAQELGPYLRTILVISDELPLSPRHEQAKLLLERARLKARSNQIKTVRPCRHSHSSQRSAVKKQEVESSNPMPEQKAGLSKEDLTVQTVSGPLLVPEQRDTSPGDQGCNSRRYGCSPTRVRFEDESEKEAESRYLDRVRQRGRPGKPKSKSRESNTDSSNNGSERSRSQRSVSMPPTQTHAVGVVGEPTTVIKEIIVLVKKCEACGSVVRAPQTASSLSDLRIIDTYNSNNPEDTRGKANPHWVPPAGTEVCTRSKASLTVTFAGASVLGEDKESRTGWKSSGFGKLRRRSRKGESRLESGNGPYGPSWAQRRNSNPRNRVNLSGAVSFAPGRPIALEPSLLAASGGLRESPTPALPIKSALKSSSRNRSAAGQSTVQFQVISTQGGEGGSQHSDFLEAPEARRESPVALTQVTPTSSPIPCIRPSTLRYTTARVTTDVTDPELWDSTTDGTAGLTGELGSGPESRQSLRGLAMSRAEDLRAELLRSEHLKAEAIWEENPDGSRKLDGRPKLFLRRFFSSIGLNSVGRLVKGSRSSSMEQLSLPTAPRVSSASPSPTRRPQPTIRIQRTPSLQTLNTVLPLAQLRKASSVQSLEKRTERSTILGEVQIPYGLAPSPQIELHRALSDEDVLASRLVRPVGRVTQAFSDGTLLLELIRPPNGPFGFVISRGKGRPDTGVYVEKVGDGGGYIGLLGIGDEILQVNGEAVAGLSLDQVTRLMTRESIATLRTMPARRIQH